MEKQIFFLLPVRKPRKQFTHILFFSNRIDLKAILEFLENLVGISQIHRFKMKNFIFLERRYFQNEEKISGVFSHGKFREMRCNKFR